MSFTNYEDAFAEARAKAIAMNRPMGIEAVREYGKRKYNVRHIPTDPTKRFGADMRCEVVEPW